MLHSQHGLCIFRDEHEEPTLVAYKRISTQYLMVYFSKSTMDYELVSFSTLLDCIPISSIKITVDFPLYSCLNKTLDSWHEVIKFVLLTYDFLSSEQQTRQLKRMKYDP